MLIESTQQSACWLDLGWAGRFYVLELLPVRLLYLGRHLVTGGIVIKLVNQARLGTPNNHLQLGVYAQVSAYVAFLASLDIFEGESLRYLRHDIQRLQQLRHLKRDRLHEK